MTRITRLTLLALLLAAPVLAAVPPRTSPRVVTAGEAAQMVGRRVYMATGSAMPTGLITPIREHAMQRNGRTDVFYMATFASNVNFTPEVSAKFHPNLLFISMSNRDAATQGHATRHRGSLFNLARRIEKGSFKLDTVVVRVSPPDARGFVSLGTTGDLTMPAINDVLRRGGKIIAEENPNVPFTGGKNRLHQSQLSAVVRSNEPLSVLGSMPATVSEQALSNNLARLIPNRRRCTLQIGIGGALAGIGDTLKHKRLDIFSEMGGDWILPVMQGPRPAARRAVFSFLHGSSELYRFADKNPAISIDSCSVVNDPQVVAQKKRMVAINTVLEVDLMGNGNAEQIGDRVISAPGGQPDFMKGASMAPTGKAILALRSINKNGGSTVVPKLSGPLVTTPSQHVDHVVTEWGATRRLRNMAPGKRVYEMIHVAHPLHRKDLATQALGQGLINEAQAAKLARSVFHAIRLSHPQLRGDLANQAQQRGLISQQQLEGIMRDMPALDPAMGAPPPPPPPPPPPAAQ